MNIFDKIIELGLDNNSYVIVGGGVLVALGEIDWDEDVDISVTRKIFDTFKAEGWQAEDWQGKTVLKKDIYDIGVSFGDWSLRDLQSDAIWIKDIPFISLEKLLVWKRQMGRDKDLAHIALIEDYLAKQSTIKSKRNY